MTPETLFGATAVYSFIGGSMSFIWGYLWEGRNGLPEEEEPPQYWDSDPGHKKPTADWRDWERRDDMRRKESLRMAGRNFIRGAGITAAAIWMNEFRSWPYHAIQRLSAEFSKGTEVTPERIISMAPDLAVVGIYVLATIGMLKTWKKIGKPYQELDPKILPPSI